MNAYYLQICIKVKAYAYEMLSKSMAKDSRAVIHWDWEWEATDCKEAFQNLGSDSYTAYKFFKTHCTVLLKWVLFCM